MFAQQRQNSILNTLTEHRSILVQQAAELYSVTEETIRRDLRVLEAQGLIVRTHGGAILADELSAEEPLKVRESINIPGKNAIGALAAQRIHSGDTIILDASTSALYVAKHLKNHRDITVITNAEQILMELCDNPNIRLICSGGTLLHSSRSYAGRLAEEAIRSYNADYLFFSCKGFSLSRGLTDSSEEFRDMKRVMLSRARKRIFLCDRTKFHRVGMCSTATLEDVDTIISDAVFPKEWTEAFEQNQIEALHAPPCK